MLPSRTKRWKISQPIPADIDQQLQAYPRILRQALYNRGYTTMQTAEQYLQAGCPHYDPFGLTGMDAAVDRLLYAVDNGEPVAIYGDYDVDGVTATVLLTEVLRALGADARPYIPNRFEEGYGLNNDALDALAADGVKVVVTVDCGIRSLAEVQHGLDAGLEMIVSDHHSPLGDVPTARAVICQRQPGDAYPDKNLAGVGLAYKIAEALFQRRPQGSAQAADWLDLVALGTVADVVPLTGENRYLVRAGIERIRQGQRQGLFSLIRAAGLEHNRCSANDIGFFIGPRLNAAGRIDTAMAAVNLLLSPELETAGLLAQELNNRNQRRQELTRSLQTVAESMVSADGAKHLLCAISPEFQKEEGPGVIGLVAARLAETYYRPAIVGAQDREFTRASCRSIDEFHITQALDECKDLMVRHGGHAKAAGFTVRNENLPELVERMQAIADRELDGQDLRPALKADLCVSLREMNPSVVFECLDRLEPTGMDNRELVFVTRGVRPLYPKTVGAEGGHLKMSVSENGIVFSAIAFRQGHWVSSMPERIDILYTYEKNYYNGNVSIQLNIRDLKPTGTPDD